MPYAIDDPAAPPISDRFSLLWLRATLAACAAGPLPPALGTTVHGALGRALKLSACAFPNPARQPCTGCRLLATCPYPRLFEPEHQQQYQGSTPPPALLVAPAASTPLQARPGTPVVLEFGLVGRGVHALPLLLTALRVLCETGLGPQRVPCTVVRVDALDALGVPVGAVQVGSSVSGAQPSPIESTAWNAGASNGHGEGTSLRLQVRTRMRLQRGGTVDGGPPSFVDLTRALVRRTDALARAYCGEEEGFPDPRAWLQAAEEVRLVDERLHWQSHQRRSASTGHRMPLDGFVGTLRYAAAPGGLRRFMGLARLGAAIGVGRGCSFGNGRYVVVAEQHRAG